MSEPAGGSSAERVREEVAAWLAAEWDPDTMSAGRPRKEFVAAVVEAGWAAPRWPRRWFGRDLSDDEGHVVEEEFRRAGAPGSGQDRHNLYAATVLTFGSDVLKERFVGPMLRGEVPMCLLYSEPGAGSDLAAVRTRAVRDGDEWVVDGQKVWTSSARTADYGMLLCRTDWSVPKHRGLSFFLFPMRQPGVEVRPLHQITGESEFNEVFLTAARVPDEHRLGELGGGWRVLQTALAYERSVMGDRARAGRADSGMAEVGDELVRLAAETGRLGDPVVRQDLAKVAALRRVNEWNALRAKAEVEQGSSSSVMSLGKLAMSRILHESARVRTALAGPRAMVEGPEEPIGDEATFLALNAYFTSIGGGTDQIQRNIIAERILGLPKEYEVDRDLPFSEVRSG
jgi:alkylation response protein AidB-like acyl-CoA dehydrogenase